MSPVGLNVLEYGYDVYDVTLPDASAHLVKPDPDGANWLVTRILYFAPAGNSASIHLRGSPQDPIVVEAGGCLELLPGGAFARQILCTGQDARLIVEFWYRPAPPNGNPPTITINP